MGLQLAESFTEGHPGYFYFVFIPNKTTVNINVQIFV